MSETDSIADALERFFAQEAEAVTRPEFLPFVQIPEFRDCLAFRIVQEVGSIVADGLALRYAPDRGWQMLARGEFHAAYAGRLEGALQTMPILLAAPTMDRADVRSALASGFETRLAAITVQEVTR